MAEDLELAISRCVRAQLRYDQKSPIDPSLKMGDDYEYNNDTIKQFLIGVDERLKAWTPTPYTFIYPDDQIPSFAHSCLSKTLFDVRIAIAQHTIVYSPGVS